MTKLMSKGWMKGGDGIKCDWVGHEFMFDT